MQEITTLPRPNLSQETRERLTKPTKQGKIMPQATTNPSLKGSDSLTGRRNGNGNGNGIGSKNTAARRYFAALEDNGDWPPELQDYNKRFTGTLDKIKRRHDGVVTTVGMLKRTLLF